MEPKPRRRLDPSKELPDHLQEIPLRQTKNKIQRVVHSCCTPQGIYSTWLKHKKPCNLRLFSPGIIFQHCTFRGTDCKAGVQKKSFARTFFMIQDYFLTHIRNISSLSHILPGNNFFWGSLLLINILTFRIVIGFFFGVVLTKNFLNDLEIRGSQDQVDYAPQ